MFQSQSRHENVGFIQSEEGRSHPNTKQDSETELGQNGCQETELGHDMSITSLSMLLNESSSAEDTSIDISINDKYLAKLGRVKRKVSDRITDEHSVVKIKELSELAKRANNIKNNIDTEIQEDLSENDLCQHKEQVKRVKKMSKIYHEKENLEKCAPDYNMKAQNGEIHYETNNKSTVQPWPACSTPINKTIQRRLEHITPTQISHISQVTPTDMDSVTSSDLDRPTCKLTKGKVKSSLISSFEGTSADREVIEEVSPEQASETLSQKFSKFRFKKTKKKLDQDSDVKNKTNDSDNGGGHVEKIKTINCLSPHVQENSPEETISSGVKKQRRVSQKTLSKLSGFAFSNDISTNQNIEAHKDGITQDYISVPNVTCNYDSLESVQTSSECVQTLSESVRISSSVQTGVKRGNKTKLQEVCELLKSQNRSPTLQSNMLKRKSTRTEVSPKLNIGLNKPSADTSPYVSSSLFTAGSDISDEDLDLDTDLTGNAGKKLKQ